MLTFSILWTALIIVFVWVEATTVSLASIWFAGGALAALICSLLNGAIWLQAVLFFGVSGLLLALLRPLTKKYLTPKITKTNVDAIVGTIGVVTQRIDNYASTGQIKLGALTWTARSTGGDVIEEGALVQVDRIEGVKAIVSTVSTPVNNH